MDIEKSQYYVVLARTRPIASRNLKSNRFIEITLQGVDTGFRYKTYIDPTFRNYNLWRDVIELLDQGRSSIVSFSYAKFTDQDHTTIDADCRPMFYRSGDCDELQRECDQYQVERKPKLVVVTPKKPQVTREDLFNDLFEVVKR